MERSELEEMFLELVRARDLEQVANVFGEQAVAVARDLIAKEQVSANKRQRKEEFGAEHTRSPADKTRYLDGAESEETLEQFLLEGDKLTPIAAVDFTTPPARARRAREEEEEQESFFAMTPPPPPPVKNPPEKFAAQLPACYFLHDVIRH